MKRRGGLISNKEKTITSKSLKVLIKIKKNQIKIIINFKEEIQITILQALNKKDKKVNNQIILRNQMSLNLHYPLRSGFKQREF